MRFVKQPQVRFTRDMAQIDGANQGYLMMLVRSQSGLRIGLRIYLKKTFPHGIFPEPYMRFTRDMAQIEEGDKDYLVYNVQVDPYYGSGYGSTLRNIFTHGISPDLFMQFCIIIAQTIARDGMHPMM